MERELVIGGFYRHFKQKLYQVRAVAIHSETREKMVVYQAMYGDFATYVRPYAMFMSEVDHEKYPEVTQQYRFEQVDPSIQAETENRQGQAAQQSGKIHQGQTARLDQTAQQEIIELELTDTEGQEEAGEAADARLLRFLDAESCREKLEVLAAMKDDLDNRVIDDMAASMDIEVPEGEMEDRYLSLRHCLQARAKYEECTRLR